MRRLAPLVLVATMISWTFSLPVSFGIVYGDCAPSCIGSQVCPAIFFCRNAWSLFPEMMLAGFVVGLAAGGIGFAYYSPRERAKVRIHADVSVPRTLLATLPFVFLGTFFYFLLLPGLRLLLTVLAPLLAAGMSLLAILVALGVRAMLSRRT